MRCSPSERPCSPSEPRWVPGDRLPSLRPEWFHRRECHLRRAGANSTPVMDVLFALNIANLQRMFSDPEQAASAYIHDLHLIPLAALSQAPGATTVVRVV